MTKRSGNFDFNNVKKLKKPKGNNVDELWGDDFDPDEVEEAIKASQLVNLEEKGLNNSISNDSIMPSYTSFNQNNRPITSTQFNNTQMVMNKEAYATNNVDKLARRDVENQLKILVEEMEVKKGEVTILRNQIKQTQISHDSTNTKIHAELAETLQATQKELCAAKAVLDFKELEIANLKMQLTKIPKISGLHLSQMKTFITKNNEYMMQEKSSARLNVSENKIDNIKFKNLNIQDTFYLNYCLDISMDIFEKAVEENNLIHKITINQISCNAVPILQNKFLENSMKKAILMQPKYTLVDNNVLKMEYVHSDIEYLLKCSKDQMNATEVNISITKIIYLSYELLHNLLTVLKEIEAELTVEDMRDIDKLQFEIYSKNLDKQSLFSGKRWHNQECGLEARRSVAVLSRIILHSDYLNKFLIQDSPLISSNIIDLFLNQLKSRNELLSRCFTFKYLNKLLQVITLIRLTNRGHYFSGLISAALDLLLNINDNPSNRLHPEIINLKSAFLKEIIFSRPQNIVLKNCVLFMKIMCNENIFIDSLCKEIPKNSLKIDDGVLFFNDDTCIIQVFYALMKFTTSNFTKSLDESFALDILEFCLNITKSNGKWIRFQKDNQCNCLYKICELSVGTAYNVTRSLAQLKSTDVLTKQQIKIVHCSIKVLAMLRARIDFIMIHAIDIHVRFQYMVNIFNEIKNQLKLDNSLNSDFLYISEFLIDKPAVDESSVFNQSWNAIL